MAVRKSLVVVQYFRRHANLSDKVKATVKELKAKDREGDGMGADIGKEKDFELVS